MNFASSRNIFTPRRRKSRHVLRWILLFILLLLIGIGLYTVLNNGRVVVHAQRVFVSDLHEKLEGFTVLHLSDLNGATFGPGQKQLASALKGKKYSAVCITGDMVGSGGDAYPFFELLSVLDPTKPVYFIAGDADPPPVGGRPDGYYTIFSDWVLGAQTRGAILIGAPEALTYNGATVWFSDALQLTMDIEAAGTAYAASGSDSSAYYAQVMEDTFFTRQRMKTDDLHIALTHKPIDGEMLQRMLSTGSDGGTSFARTVDLFLAGGTVGGQWRIPFKGGLWSDGWFPDDTLVQGLHYVGSSSLLQYISAGLGTDAASPLPSLRLFNAPEATLLTFVSTLEDGALPAGH